jgi:hypothetical protein
MTLGSSKARQNVAPAATAVEMAVGRQAGSYCCRAASTPAMLATAAGAKAGGIGLVGPRALAAYLPCHPEHLLRNIMAKLKLEAMGRRSDPLTHGPLDVLLKK